MSAASLAQSALELARQALAQGRQPAKVPQAPVDQAAKEELAKQSKLQVAHDAAMLADMMALQKADRDKVRRLENKTLFGGVEEPGMPEDETQIVVCDDYNASTNTTPPRPNSVMGHAAAGLGGVGLAAALLLSTNLLSKPAAPAAPPAVTAPVSTPATSTAPKQSYDAVYEQQQPDGSWREIRREHLK